MVSAVDSWWEQLQSCGDWLDSTQAALSEKKPLASSVPLLEDQERSVKVGGV